MNLVFFFMCYDGFKSIDDFFLIFDGDFWIRSHLKMPQRCSLHYFSRIIAPLCASITRSDVPFILSFTR